MGSCIMKTKLSSSFYLLNIDEHQEKLMLRGQEWLCYVFNKPVAKAQGL